MNERLAVFLTVIMTIVPTLAVMTFVYRYRDGYFADKLAGLRDRIFHRICSLFTTKKETNKHTGNIPPSFSWDNYYIPRLGVEFDQGLTEFYIDKKDLDAALAAIKDLKGDETVHIGQGDPHFRWVSSTFYEIDNFEEMLAELRWQVEFDDKKNVVGIEFTGQKEGDDAYLFNAIAPYVKNGSSIVIHTSLDEECKWMFDGSIVWRE